MDNKNVDLFLFEIIFGCSLRSNLLIWIIISRVWGLIYYKRVFIIIRVDLIFTFMSFLLANVINFISFSHFIYLFFFKLLAATLDPNL